MQDYVATVGRIAQSEWGLIGQDSSKGIENNRS